jgi:mycofactocin precursor
MDEPKVEQSVTSEPEHDLEADELATDVLVEEVSIDGMCGVY